MIIEGKIIKIAGPVIIADGMRELRCMKWLE